MCRRQSSGRWEVGQVSNLPCVGDLPQFGRLETCPTFASYGSRLLLCVALLSDRMWSPVG